MPPESNWLQDHALLQDALQASGRVAVQVSGWGSLVGFCRSESRQQLNNCMNLMREDVERNAAQVDLHLFQGRREAEVIGLGEPDDDLVTSGERCELQRLTVFSMMRRHRRRHRRLVLRGLSIGELPLKGELVRVEADVVEGHFLSRTVSHRLVAVGRVADVVDPTDSQLDGKALRGHRRDVFQPNGRISEQHLKKRSDKGYRESPVSFIEHAWLTVSRRKKIKTNQFNWVATSANKIHKQVSEF